LPGTSIPRGPFFGRVYISYADEIPNESDDTDIFVRYSDNNGVNWSAPIRVNDDATTRSQFFARIAVDPSSGALAASWYDCRNDSGSGDGNRSAGPNNDAQFYGSVSFDGGVTWSANVRISSGTSTEGPAQNPNDYGDYTALAFHNGSFYPVWGDNSNSTDDNPDDAVSMELCTARVRVGIVAENPVIASEMCLPANGILEPGETVTVNVPLRNALGPVPTNLVATLLSSGGVSLPSGPQDYGALASGGPAMTRAFTFTPSGNCGGTVNATLQLQDGAKSFGTVTLNFPLGLRATNIQTITASGAITVPDQSAGSPYPKTLNVAGYTGTPNKVTVTIIGLSHPYPDDFDILLVGPRGQKVMLMSDAGYQYGLNNAAITLDDEAPRCRIFLRFSLEHAPANHFFGSAANDAFPAPAPAAPYLSTLSAFEGLDPNGTWSLYVRDDGQADIGGINGGWSLQLWNISATCCEPPVSLGLVRSGNNVQLTWPSSAAGYVLEAKNDLDPMLIWEIVPNATMTSNGVSSVTVPVGTGNRFFRLRK
jgi:subtilisin-like proprotein convertase family protein